jgi:hypothetical protein
MSTEKKNEKWKTFYMEERKGNGVQSFSLPMGFLSAQPDFPHKLKAKASNTEGTEGTEKTRKWKPSYPFFSLCL